MEKRTLIENEIKAHLYYATNIQQAPSAFCTQYYHPKTGKRITYSEMCTLIDIDLQKRVKRIEKLFSNI